jgi:hypothetical protein
MIVYGDPSFHASISALASELASRAREASVAPGAIARSLDRIRRLLIRAGQLEQAVEDSGDLESDLLRAVRSSTDRAAEAFHAIWTSKPDAAQVIAAIRSIEEGLCGMSGPNLPATLVWVKVPEGFAFYTLFPEQYFASAMAWSGAQKSRSGSVIVIGIRSIGTTLSAIVRAQLAESGWDVRRMTVRPGGHPFDRKVTLHRDALAGIQHALIVDEGPGASGSSMAAVARGLAVAGFDSSRISFLPGHHGEPGPQASAEVRRWWADTPRYVVPLDDLRWNGLTLQEQLAERTRSFFPESALDRIEDLSGGKWRDLQFANSDSPPPAFPAFERTKYRHVLRDGRAVLWKFVGLDGGAQKTMAQLSARADAGWTARPLGTAFGFVALPWIAGTPLSRRAFSSELIDQMGRYIRESAGPVMSREELSNGFERLREMLYWNAMESLGQDAGQRANELSKHAMHLLASQSHFSYGDGRLAPCEWIRTPRGALQKVDCAGHDADHTMVGRLPLVWDVAGAAIEWKMDKESACSLLSTANASNVHPGLFDFHRAAYAALRMGMASMSRTDPTFYREQLVNVLFN